MVKTCTGLKLVLESLDTAGAHDAADLVRTALADCETKSYEGKLNNQILPPLLIRGLNFTSAMFRWASSGMPRRTQSEIDERLAICQGCPHFVDSHCRVCGCACVETNQLINKLALATEECPLGKWK